MKRSKAPLRFGARLGLVLGGVVAAVRFAPDAAAQAAVEPAPFAGTPNHPPPEAAPAQPVNAANKALHQ
jgi:hypothetical protein